MMGLESGATTSARRDEFARILRFCISGVINTGVDFAVFAALVFGLHVWPVAANVVAFSAAVASSYGLNRYWTFASASKETAGGSNMLLFVVLTTGVAILSTVSLWILIRLGTPVMVAKAIATVISMVSNYLLMSKVIFAAQGRMHSRAREPLKPAENENGRA